MWIQREKDRASFLPALAFKDAKSPIKSMCIVTVTNFSLKRIADNTVLKTFFKQTETRNDKKDFLKRCHSIP